MARTKIDYGIDLGTTNSAICRMDAGEVSIKKTDTLKDTMPSSVYINKKQALQVGDSAYNNLRRDKLKAMRNWESSDSNAFIEFKRTMGTDKMYPCSHLNKEFNSEELSSEVLKTLKSFVKDEGVHSIVITVPAKFTFNQKDATRRAGELAGFQHIELLQEPIAASMAYGLESDSKDGYWLVFDYGGGTFDAALLKVEEGIMIVKDTEGDNYLGGKNLDNAIVDEIIIPYFKENYAIDSILKDDNKLQILRQAMKFYAEDAKIKLSFNESHNILSDLGDIPGEDDNGEEFELDITVTQSDLKKVLTPVFQKAIDISLELLKRNNISGSDLDSLVLVGGPTFSPVLREMLGSQICAPDTSTDPMTAVAKGAALYASTIDVAEEIREQTRDKAKVQLLFDHESSTVEMEEFVTVKMLSEKMTGTVPEKATAEITRGDGGWSSGRFALTDVGDVIEVQLEDGKTNSFTVDVFDETGDKLESEPNSFSIIQGSKIGSATLPYNIGIEIKTKTSGKVVFSGIRGVEKNQSLPAIGTRNGLKTQSQIRPGEEKDIIKFPIYQGETGSEGTRAIYNEHVYDVIITGDDLPSLLPVFSDVDLTISVDKSEKISLSAYFPYLDYTHEITVPSNQVKSIDPTWLSNEIRKGIGSIQEIKDDEDRDYNDRVKRIEQELVQIESDFSRNKNDIDANQQILARLRKSLKSLDEEGSASEWPRLEEKLKQEYLRLERADATDGNERTTKVVALMKTQMDEVIASKNVKFGNILLEEMESAYFQITMLFQLMHFIREHNNNFARYSWKDTTRARTLLDQGMEKMSNNPTKEELHPIVIGLFNLLPPDEQPSGDSSVLMG
ncbi:MAG: Hsp70 family protein [Crocinitomicaceae bacterium]